MAEVSLKKKKKKKGAVSKSVKRFATKTTSGVAGGESSKYVDQAGYKLESGETLYRGSQYVSRGSGLDIDDIPSAGHVAQTKVADYVKGVDTNYGGYLWQGKVLKISGSSGSYSVADAGKI